VTVFKTLRSTPDALTQVETELKFIVPRDRLDALAADMRRGEVHVRRLMAIYCDTVDGRLAASNVSIRLRREGRRWVQTAKALTPDPLRRLEHNVERTVLGGFEAPELDLSLHDGTPAGLAIRAAIGVLAQLIRVVVHGGLGGTVTTTAYASHVPSKRATRWISARLRECIQRCDRALRKAVKRPVFWQD
jgi:hypothetical protein